MYICPNCNNTSEEKVNFCQKCGSAMVYSEPVVAPPVAENVGAEYNYGMPVPPMPVKKVHLAKKIVSIALAGEGLALGILSLYFSLLFGAMGALDSMLAVGMTGVGALYSFIFGGGGLAMSIVGFVMAKSNISNGDTSKLSSIAKKLGLIGLILSSAALFVGIVSFFTTLNTVIYY